MPVNRNGESRRASARTATPRPRTAVFATAAGLFSCHRGHVFAITLGRVVVGSADRASRNCDHVRRPTLSRRSECARRPRRRLIFSVCDCWSRRIPPGSFSRSVGPTGIGSGTGQRDTSGSCPILPRRGTARPPAMQEYPREQLSSRANTYFHSAGFRFLPKNPDPLPARRRPSRSSS